MTKIPLLFLILFAAGCTISGNVAIEPAIETTNTKIEAYFCQRTNCEQKIADFLNNAQKISCAFYSLKSQKLHAILKEKNAKVTAEDDNKEDFHLLNTKTDKRSQLMHNKFCTADGNMVLTGSFNPAQKSTSANNILIIPSKYIAQNYEDEFEEMFFGVFGAGAKVKHPKVILNEKLIENYFCPEDLCQEKLIQTINSAKQSIYFMTYSFTDNKIAQLLLEKSKSIEVAGIFDSSQLSQWSQYDTLKDLSIIKKGVHHKVFIIDQKIVLSGSYNPTKNGNTQNDENIVIIHDKEIAQKFLEEFNLLFG